MRVTEFEPFRRSGAKISNISLPLTRWIGSVTQESRDRYVTK